MATKGIVLVAGLAAVTACASLEPSEPETKSASSALGVSPTVAAGTSAPTSHERAYGASCTLWDTGASRDVVISAFGRQGTGSTYLNTYDIYDPGTTSWGTGGTVSGGGNTATAAAYVSAVTGPETDGNNAHLTTCYFAGGADNANVYKQVWRARVASGTVTWVKMTDMNVPRAKFGLSWGGSTTKKLIAVGGGFGTTRTDTIETFNLGSPGAWATETPTLNEALHSFGFVKLSASKFVTAGGDGATNNPSDHINAIKVNVNGTVDSVGDILTGGGATVIAARKDNIVVPTGKTGLTGTDPAEIMVAMGLTGTTLLASATKVVIAWNSSTTAPSYVSNSAGVVPTSAALPTVVDAYLAPYDAASNPGYLVISGHDAAGSQLAINTIQKWNPSTTGGSWAATPASFGAGRIRTGVNASYVKSIDKVIPSGGADRFPATGSTTYLLMDQIN